MLSEEHRKPVSGVIVVLESNTHQRRTSISNVIGVASFDLIPPGKWLARCVAAGGVRELRVEAGAEVETWFEISGDVAVVHVLDSKGSPVLGANVRVSRQQSETGISIGTTDVNGRLEVRPFRQRIYVEANASGFVPSGRRDLRPETPERTIHLHPGGGAISGRIIDTDTGEGVEEAVITIGYGGFGTSDIVNNVLYPGTSPLELMSGDNGFFFGDGLPGSDHACSVVAAGYATWIGTAQIPEGSGTGQLLVALDRGSQIDGHALTPDGSPVAGAHIRISSGEGLELESLTRPDGRFSFEHVGPGPVNVHARHVKYGQGTVALQLTTVDEVIDLVLTHDLTVGGIVVDSDGRPIHGAKVGQWLGGPGKTGALILPALTDDSGSFRRLLPSSDLQRLAVLYPANALFPLKFFGAKPGKLDMVLEVNAATLLPGSFTVRTDMTLEVRQSEVSEAIVYQQAQTDNETLVIGPLPPGTYSVHAFDDLANRKFIGTFSLAPGEALDLGHIAR